MPGTAVATTSRAPLDTSLRDKRRIPCRCRYSTRAVSGQRARATTSPPSSLASRRTASYPRACSWPYSLDRCAASGSWRELGAPICTTMARNPLRTARLATTPLTVVFPTPPLPVTMSTLACVRKVNGPKARLLWRTLARQAKVSPGPGCEGHPRVTFSSDGEHCLLSRSLLRSTFGLEDQT